MLLAWIISIAIFLLYVFIMVIHATISSEHYQHWDEAIYTILTSSFLYSYQILIGYLAYSALKQNEILQPIGKGLIYIWEYFCNDLHHAAKFFIVSEMVVILLNNHVSVILNNSFLSHFRPLISNTCSLNGFFFISFNWRICRIRVSVAHFALQSFYYFF